MLITSKPDPQPPRTHAVYVCKRAVRTIEGAPIVAIEERGQCFWLQSAPTHAKKPAFHEQAKDGMNT